MDAPRPPVAVEPAAWLRSAAIYQLNARQFTPESTLLAAAAHLPRIAALGATVVWLMPIHPIGEAQRKGTLGSPYAVRDYTAVNPELGTLDDLRAFVAAAHARSLRVILDWVANHVARDHPWVRERPEWIARDGPGAPRATPWSDWDDVADLDYAQPGLWRAMEDAMAFWVRECDVDGFRCDVAGYVPTAFWEGARRRLWREKPVFMLAEWEARDLHAAAFDASYAWSWHDALEAVARGSADAHALREVLRTHVKAWPRGAMRMAFVSNHDKNTWEGTAPERFGAAHGAAVAFTVLAGDVPLVYTSQEVGEPRRLAFFERDPVDWGAEASGEAAPHPTADLYRRLFALKHATPALWNGRWGGLPEEVPVSAPEAGFAFKRASGESAVLAVFNLSPEAREMTLHGASGLWRDAFTGEAEEVAPEAPLAMEPWGWRAFVR
jgi:glycosidase